MAVVVVVVMGPVEVTKKVCWRAVDGFKAVGFDCFVVRSLV